MKKIVLTLLFVIYGVYAYAGQATPPTGEEALDALFSNGDTLLKNEPLCDMSYPTRNGDLTLDQYLSTVLASAYDNDNASTLSFSCSESRHEVKSGHVVDSWECQFSVTESSSSGEYIANSSLFFGLSRDEKSLLVGSLRCL